jgi:hypothetical protein
MLYFYYLISLVPGNQHSLYLYLNQANNLIFQNGIDQSVYYPRLEKFLKNFFSRDLWLSHSNKMPYPAFNLVSEPNMQLLHQLHRVVDHIATSLETIKYCSGLFLDVAQAFDAVWHDGSLYKLKKTFPVPYYLLLKLYLNNWTFRVKLKTTFSSSQNILAVVPQGSDIAPFLYTLFTADIPTTDNILLGTYADDTAILSSSQDPHEASGLLQNHLNSLFHWFKSWKIKINNLLTSPSPSHPVTVLI